MTDAGRTDPFADIICGPGAGFIPTSTAPPPVNGYDGQTGALFVQ